MNKKIVAPLVILIALLLAGVAYLGFSLSAQKQANRDMQELADMDKREMENEYEQFALQYSEMKTRINNDSIVAQLTREQLRTQQLLEELKQVKSSDAREIARLKKELATVRAVLRSYVLEIDSLNRLNQNLTAENTQIKGQLEESTRQIEGLSTEKASLSEKVAIAAQLDATNISLTAKKKNGKDAKKVKDAKTLEVAFVIARNVTAANGSRPIYVRVTNPTGDVLGNGEAFAYENRQLKCTMKRNIEYTGEETPVATYWNIDQFLESGTYNVSIFADGHLIGQRIFTLK